MGTSDSRPRSAQGSAGWISVWVLAAALQACGNDSQQNDMTGDASIDAGSDAANGNGDAGNGNAGNGNVYQDAAANGNADASTGGHDFGTNGGNDAATGHADASTGGEHDASGSSARNHGPKATAHKFSTAEDTALTGTVTASDADHDTLTFAVVTEPAHGALDLEADTGDFTYMPDANYRGSDSFEFQASDGDADSNTAQISITITSVDDAPSAVDDEATLAEGGSVTMLQGGASSVLANDGDVEGSELTVNTLPVAGVAHGTLTLNNDGTFSYVHDGGESTTDAFTYEVCDPSSVCSTATVSIAITAVNDAPVAYDQSLSTAEDVPVTGTLTASDADGDALSFHVIAFPMSGGIVFDASGGFTYTPSPEYVGPDVVAFKADDGSATSDFAFITFDVSPVNDPPHPLDDVLTVAKGGTATMLADDVTSVTANDVDYDGDAITVDTTPVTDVSHGTLTLNADGTFIYTHDDSETSSDSFVYRICDASNACTTATVNITITAGG
jgi:VCBS repeat-containing protein